MTPAARVAALLRITEGQVYTVTTSLVLALLLLGLGLPSLRAIAPPFTADQVRTTPLALPGSPAVADIIVAASPASAPDVPGQIESAAEFAGAPSAPAFTTPPRISTEAPPTTEARVMASPTAEPEPSSTPSESPTPAPPAPTALRITEARYATASGPLVPSGPPGTFLPVGLRLGAPDKQSYLRLAGSGTTLELKLSSQPVHQFGEVSAVRACRIIPAVWNIADGSPLAAAPEVDPIDCTLGRPGPTGYTFELGGVDTRNGVALVPSGPSTGSFQVTFAGSPS